MIGRIISRCLRHKFSGSGICCSQYLCALYSLILGIVAAADIYGQTKAQQPSSVDASLLEEQALSTLWVKVKSDYSGTLNSVNGRSATLPGIAAIRPLVPGSQRPAGRRGPFQQQVDITRYYTLAVAKGTSIQEAISSLQATGYFEVIEPVYLNRALTAPNDPAFSSQPYLDLIRTTQAWDITQGDDTMVIGIIDTGGDLDHPDLRDKLFVNAQDPVDGVDNDGDGYVDNYRGWDFSGDVAANVGGAGFTGDNDPSVPKGGIFGHGTMVAGCAAATTDNGVGIAAVGRNARLLFTKHFSDDQDAYASNYSSNTYLGVLYAATHGARIINCSWGSYHPSTIAQDIINYVTLDLGCLVIAAAGNSNLEAPMYPASYDNVLSVGSSTINDERTYFSNFGQTLDLVAPGDVIHTTQYNDGYITDSGTSLSTPIVSGAAALVWSLHPEYSPLQVAEQLRVSADATIYENSPTYLHKLGFGRLDVLSALTMEGPAIRVSRQQLSDENGVAPTAGSTVSMVLDFTNYLRPSSSSLTATISTASPYAVVNKASFNIGTLGTGATRGNGADPFTLTLSTALPMDEAVEVLVTIKDGSYEDHQLISFAIPSYVEIRENNIITSLSANGRIGYGKPDTQGNGRGFLYNEESLLFEMGFIAGSSATDLYNNVRAVGGVWDEDFIPQGPIRKVIPGDRSFSEVAGKVITGDERLAVQYRTLLWNEDPDRNFVIVEYVVENTSAQPITGLYFGLFADWDIADQGAHDGAGWDPDTRLGYVFPVSNVQLPRTGIQALTGAPQYRALDNDQAIAGNPFGLYDGFTDEEKFISVSSGISKAEAGQLPNGGDVSHTVGSGPYSIDPSERITVAFAIHAAPTQQQLIASARRAHTLYNYTLKSPVPVIADIKVCADAPVVLEPTGAGQYSLYSTFTGGQAIATGPTVTVGALKRDSVVYLANADHDYESLRIPVVINVVARPLVNADGDPSFCDGDSVMLTTEESDAYLWTTGESTRTIKVATEGNYSVQVQKEGITCASANSLAVTVHPLPDASFSVNPDLPRVGEQTVFTASNTQAETWLWKNDGVISGDDPVYGHVFVEEGIYTITLSVTDGNHCTGTSSSQWGLITGHEAPFEGVTLYPNPVKSENVKLSLPAGAEVAIEIFDILGRLRLTRVGRAEALEEINVQYLPNGQYMLRITEGGRSATQKFVVAR